MKPLAFAVAAAALLAAPAAWGASWCDMGMEPVAKKADGMIACVMPGTAQVLIERGWGESAPEAPAVDVQLPAFLEGKLGSPGFTAEERAWLSENRQIFVAYDPGWAPYEYEAAGKLSGLASYYMPAFEYMSGVDFVQHDADSWTGALEAVREGGNRVLLAVGITEERKEFLGFTDPHTALTWDAVTLEGAAVETASLADYRVGVGSDYAVVGWLDANMPDVEYSTYDTEPELFEALVSGKIDVLLQPWGVVLASADRDGTLIANSGQVGEDLLLAAAYPKDEAVLGSIMQKLVSAVPRETYEEIASRALFDYRLTGTERAWLDSDPVVTVGIDTDWPPYEYVEDGAVSGQTKMYMDEISRLTGISFTTDTRPWDQLVEEQRKGGATALFAVAETPQRSEFMGFTRPYAPALWSMVTDGPQSLQPSDLADLKVGAIRGYAVHEWMEANMPDVEFAPQESHAAAFEALQSGDLDVFLDTWEVVRVSAERQGVTGLYRAGVLDGDNPISPVSMGYPKGQEELGSVLQKALDSITPERRQMFASQATFEALLTGDEKAYLASSPTARVAYDPDGFPVEYRNEDGMISGFALRYMGIIGGMTGIEFRQVDTETWSGSIDAMREGRADVMFALTETPERTEFMGFTEPYASLPWNIVTTGTEAVGDISGLGVGTIEGYAIEAWLDENMPDVEYTSYPDHAAAVGALSSGDIDALLDTYFIVAAAAGEDSGLFNAGVVGDDLALSIGYASDQQALGGVLQKAMDALPDSLHQWVYSTVTG